MPHEAFLDQRRALIEGMTHWLELFDEDLAGLEVNLSDRPKRAMFMLFQDGGIQVKIGETPVDLSKPVDHARTEWFHILYDAIRLWYVERYGADAMRPKGNPPLEGIVMVRGTPFRLAVPAHRNKVEEEGKTAWMYFEDGVGEGENPVEWLRNGPAVDSLDENARKALTAEANEVAGTLRFIQFRRVTAGIKDDQEARKLVATTSTYLQQAARRIVSGSEQERGPAWFDLQMAAESALKAVIRHREGSQPHIHKLVELVRRARDHGVSLEESIADDWPEFRELSDWRYGQGDPWSLRWLHKAYLTTLKIAGACMANMPVGLQPGFGILLEYPPWLREID